MKISEISAALEAQGHEHVFVTSAVDTGIVCEFDYDDAEPGENPFRAKLVKQGAKYCFAPAIPASGHRDAMTEEPVFPFGKNIGFTSKSQLEYCVEKQNQEHTTRGYRNLKLVSTDHKDVPVGTPIVKSGKKFWQVFVQGKGWFQWQGREAASIKEGYYHRTVDVMCENETAKILMKSDLKHIDFNRPAMKRDEIIKEIQDAGFDIPKRLQTTAAAAKSGLDESQEAGKKKIVDAVTKAWKSKPSVRAGTGSMRGSIVLSLRGVCITEAQYQAALKAIETATGSKPNTYGHRNWAADETEYWNLTVHL